MAPRSGAARPRSGRACLTAEEIDRSNDRRLGRGVHWESVRGIPDAGGKWMYAASARTPSPFPIDMEEIMSPTARRTALVLVGAAMTTALAACQTAARPFSRFTRTTASTSAESSDRPRCDFTAPGTLRVVNQAGKVYDIHVSRRGTPRVWLARAPVGASSVTVLGPSDHTARYFIVRRDKPVVESAVSWKNRTLTGQGLMLELQCAPLESPAQKGP